jgi:hypothetical protein
MTQLSSWPFCLSPNGSSTVFADTVADAGCTPRANAGMIQNWLNPSNAVTAANKKPAS